MNVGLKARLMSRFMRKAIPLLQKNGSTLILLNHVKQSIMQYGSSEYTTGGRSIEHYTSLRIKMTMTDKLKKGDEIVGAKFLFKITKNKVGRAFTEIKVPFMFEEGFNASYDLIEQGLVIGILKKEGNTIFYGDIKMGVGANKARLFLEEDKTFAAKLQKELTS